MPEPIEEVRVRVSAETAAFVNQVDNAVNKGTKKLGAFGGVIKQITSNWASLGATIGTAIAGAVSYRALEGAIDKTKQLGLAVHELNEQTGLSAESSSKLLYAAQHFDLTVEDLTRGLGILAKKLKGVQDEETGVTTGGKSTAQILADMGIKATDTAGQLVPMTELLPQIADYFQTLPNGVEKTGLAMQLFGRGGRIMIEFLNAGAAGLAALGVQAEKLGLVLSEDNVAAIKKYTFAQKDWQQAVGGLKLMVGMELMPVLTRLLAWLISVQPQMRQFITSLGSAIGTVRAFGAGIPGALGPAAQSLGAMAAAVTLVVAGFAAFQALHFIAEMIKVTATVQAFTASTTVASGAWAAFKVMASTLPGALALVAVAVLAVDQALRVVTGSGALEWLKKFADNLTGAAAAAERAAKATALAGDAQAYYNARVREGMPDQDARNAALGDLSDKARTTMQAWTDMENALAGKPQFLVGGLTKQFAADMDALVAQIKTFEPTYGELLMLFQQSPGLARYLQPEMKAAAQAFADAHPELTLVWNDFQNKLVPAAQATAKALAEVGKSAGELAQQTTDVNTLTASLADTVLPAFGLGLEELKLKERQNELQALADTLGDAFPDARQHELDAVTNKLGLLGRKADEVKLQIQELGLRFVTAFGPEAAAKYQEVLDFLGAIPPEKVVEIFPLLNALSAAKVLSFINFFKQGFVIPLAFELAELNVSPAMASTIANLPLGMGKGMMNAIQAIGTARQQAIGTGLDVEKMASQFTGTADKAAEKFTDMTQSLDELTSTLLGLGRAAGMADSQLAGYPWTLELARRAAERLGLTTDDLLDIFNATGAGFADFMRELAANEALDALKQQADAVGQALDDLRSQFSALFGKPTREESQINYQLAQLKLQRAQAVAGGAPEAALAGIDKQIKQMEAVVEVRGAEKDVLKAQLDMADRTALSDADQLSRGQDLISKMADLSAAAVPVIALYQSQATLMQTWMDSLASLIYTVKAIPLPGAEIPPGTPSMASGGIVPGPIGQPKLILAHGGEPILPAGSGTFSLAMPITLNIQGAPDWMEIARKAHEAVTEALHAARTRTYLGGAPIGAGIG